MFCSALGSSHSEAFSASGLAYLWSKIKHWPTHRKTDTLSAHTRCLRRVCGRGLRGAGGHWRTWLVQRETETTERQSVWMTTSIRSYSSSRPLFPVSSPACSVTLLICICSHYRVPAHPPRIWLQLRYVDFALAFRRWSRARCGSLALCFLLLPAMAFGDASTWRSSAASRTLLFLRGCLVQRL